MGHAVLLTCIWVSQKHSCATWLNVAPLSGEARWTTRVARPASAAVVVTISRIAHGPRVVWSSWGSSSLAGLLVCSQFPMELPPVPDGGSKPTARYCHYCRKALPQRWSGRMPLYCDRSCRDAAYWRRKHRWHDPHNDLLRDYHALEECHRALWQRYEDLDESYKELWTDYQEACHEL